MTERKQMKYKKIYEIWINYQLNTLIMRHSLTSVKGSDNVHGHTLCPSSLTNASRKDNALFSKESHNPPLSYCFFFLQISSLHCFQKLWCVVQPVHASLYSQYKFHLTATHTLFVLCARLRCYCTDSFCPPSWNNHHRTEEESVCVCFWS